MTCVRSDDTRHGSGNNGWLISVPRSDHEEKWNKYLDAVSHPECTYDDVRDVVLGLAKTRGAWGV